MGKAVFKFTIMLNQTIFNLVVDKVQVHNWFSLK